MNSVYVLLSSFYIKLNLNIVGCLPIYGDYKSIFSVCFVSKEEKNIKNVSVRINKTMIHSKGNVRKMHIALASIALLVAQSHPEQKDIIIKLVMNMLYEGEV